MSKPKKPRNKRHSPRLPNIPMMTETRNGLALELRMAIEALIYEPSIDLFNHVSTRLITLGRVCGVQPCLESAKQAMLDVFARFERVGRMGVSPEEAESLRAASGEMDSMLAMIPVNKLAVSELKTIAWCKANGVCV